MKSSPYDPNFPSAQRNAWTLYSLSVGMKAQYAVVFALHLRNFGHKKVILQEISVISAKFVPQGSKNYKILGSDPG